MLKFCLTKSPDPKNVYASAIGLWKDSCLIAKERYSVPRQLDGSPLGSLLSTRSTRWSPRDGGPKAEGCNLRMRTCTQSLQRSHFNRSLRDTIPPAGGFRVSSVPPAVIVHASTAAARCQRYSVPSAQIRCISTASLRATATTARAEAAALRNAEPPNPNAGERAARGYRLLDPSLLI